MTFNNLRTNEPAFISNEKYAKTNRPQGFQKDLTSCCYSLANLALIVSCIAALVLVIKFFYDEILYDYAEHLLGLRFYRQLIFVGIAVALVLFIPLLNMVYAFFCTSGESRSTVMGAKLFYQLIMVVLMFIGLVLVAPSMRQSSVENQLRPELRKHMTSRYVNDFSYVLLDGIQDIYNCCDVLWYRDHYFDKLPLTCYVSNYGMEKKYECAEVLGSLVSQRSVIIACCLVAILVSLAILCGLEALACLLSSSDKNKYNVEAREAKQLAVNPSSDMTSSNSQGNTLKYSDDDDDDDDGDDDSSSRTTQDPSPGNQGKQETRHLGTAAETTRLSQLHGNQQSPSKTIADHFEEWKSRRPLLNKTSREPYEQRRLPALSGDPYNSSTPVYQPTTEPILLTRAQYVPGPSRAQSPLFPAGRRDLQAGISRTIGAQTSGSSMKKSNSILRITDDEDDLDADMDIDCNTTSDQLKRESQSHHGSKMSLERDTQTRRSLLSVRFAE